MCSTICTFFTLNIILYNYLWQMARQRHCDGWTWKGCPCAVRLPCTFPKDVNFHMASRYMGKNSHIPRANCIMTLLVNFQIRHMLHPQYKRRCVMRARERKLLPVLYKYPRSKRPIEIECAAWRAKCQEDSPDNSTCTASRPETALSRHNSRRFDGQALV